MGYINYDEFLDYVPYDYSIEELQTFAAARKGTTWAQLSQELTSHGFDPTDYETLVAVSDVAYQRAADGSVYTYVYHDRGNFSYSSTSINSNSAVTTRAEVSTPMNVGVDEQTGKVTVSNTPKTGSFATNAAYILGEVGQAVTAANVGIWLGKTIDSALYNAAPDYWDSIGMSSLNPETWGSITSGDDSFGSQLFNWIFGIDPDTGKMQAYMDADAAAYIAYALKKNNWFVHGSGTAPSENFVTGYQPTVDDFIVLNDINAVADFLESMGATRWEYGSKSSFISNWGPTFAGKIFIVGVKQTNICCFPYTPPITIQNGTLGTITNNKCNGPIINGYVDKYLQVSSSGFAGFVGTTATRINLYSGTLSSNPSDLAAFMGTFVSQPEGVSDQTGATLPNTSTWNDIPSTDSYLRNAYPDTYNDAITYDALQPDGTVLTKEYIPVPWANYDVSPDVSNTPWNEAQPTSGGTSQTDTLIDVETDPLELIKTLIKILTQPTTNTDVTTPTDTGDGSTPTPTPSSGSASALWSVYHPTQAQVDSFGAWLWTDNIITQIQQLLQNPMDGIITLHKVFATPVDSGTGTIVVGRLDSQVSSATVSQQYVYVDCGDVDLYEEFGMVYDYSPYTYVSLYLPFIGIVPLNVAEVMRSTINVTYGVDVFTGACLAMVTVSRDGNDVNMYQYAGCASVEYPLTGGVHSGLLNGILGIAGGVAGLAAASTGVGMVAGATAIAGGAANMSKINNAHASSFSGNSGAMGIKIPYLIIERPQTKLANTFDILSGYPTNYSVRLGDCSGQVKVSHAHVENISATDIELKEIEKLLHSGLLI